VRQPRFTSTRPSHSRIFPNLFHEVVSKSLTHTGFFAIQTPEPVSIPEWWLDSLGEPDRMISNMETFLAAYGYPATSNYVGPNCINVPISASPTYPTTCDTTDQINDLNIDPLDQ
jgi:hypothetical protein